LSLAYRPTSRWTILTRAYAVDTASTNVANEQQDIPVLVPHMFTAEGYLTVYYALTPSLQIGAAGSLLESRSVFADYQVVSGTLSIQKKFARKWFTKLDGGAGWLSSPADNVNSPHGVSYIYSGSLGVAGRENSLMATYSRQLGDYYGFASGSTTSVLAIWNWRGRSQNWGFNVTGGQQHLAGSSLGTLSVWQASAGISHAFGRQSTMTWSYVNLTDTASTVRPGDFSVHAVRVAIVWVPFLREVRPRVNLP
jgi:hypothetical protein